MTAFEATRKRALPLARHSAKVADIARRKPRRKAMAKGDQLAVALGRGLVAGAVGTAAMTLSTTIETKLRGRAESDAPAEAVETVVGIEPTSEEAEARLATASHWLYGTSWGGARGLLGLTELDPGKATALHGVVVWASALVMLPAFRVAPPPNQWGLGELAIDAFHHAVYAGASGIAYEALDR